MAASIKSSDVHSLYLFFRRPSLDSSYICYNSQKLPKQPSICNAVDFYEISGDTRIHAYLQRSKRMHKCWRRVTARRSSDCIGARHQARQLYLPSNGFKSELTFGDRDQSLPCVDNVRGYYLRVCQGSTSTTNVPYMGSYKRLYTGYTGGWV